ncbi:MAG: thioredoxin family protein [Bacteroidota bacterium]
MKVKLLAYMLVLLGLLTSCKEKQYLVGYYSYDKFQKECKWDYFVDEKYADRAKERWLDSLSTIEVSDSLRLQLFLGCYCGDSKKWVPRYYALKDQLPIADVEIISVDTTKKDEKNLAGLAGIEKIPTFIFYQGSREIGRIVEKPKGRIEKNLFHLLKNCE